MSTFSRRSSATARGIGDFVGGPLKKSAAAR
jgi:hypothetical protein